jgi:hypothetical protein
MHRDSCPEVRYIHERVAHLDGPVRSNRDTPVVDPPARRADIIVHLHWRANDALVHRHPGRHNLSASDLVVAENETAVPLRLLENVEFETTLNVLEVGRAVGECQALEWRRRIAKHVWATSTDS